MSADTGEGRETVSGPRLVSESNTVEDAVLDALGGADLTGVVLVGLDDDEAASIEEVLDGVVNDAAIRRA